MLDLALPRRANVFTTSLKLYLDSLKCGIRPMLVLGAFITLVSNLYALVGRVSWVDRVS